MMGSQNHSFEDDEEESQMESLIINEPPSSNGKSFSDYRTSTSSLAGSHRPPIFVTPAEHDPLLAPLAIRDLRNPNASENSYLESPSPSSSYADVIFSSFSNGVESPRLELENRSSSSSFEYLTITVSNPQKEQENSSSIVPGAGTYVTYLITTRTNMPEYGGSDFRVRRRFKDVVTLSDRLSESYRGFFVPPRPDKSVVESQVMQKQEFVEQRRVALEKYLCRLATHPVISRSGELKAFLQIQGKLPPPGTTDVAYGAAKLPKQLFGETAVQEAAQPAKGGMDLMRLFKELKQSVAIDWGGSRPALVEEDKEFIERKEKLHELEQQLSNASQQAESLVKAQQDIGETLGELGLTFIKLTKFENEEAVFSSQRARAADMKNVATASVKASRLQRESNAKTVKHLDTLHEYLGLMLAVHSAFSDRSSALLTVQTLLSELSSLQSRAEKLEVSSSKIFGADKSKIRKMEELKESIRAAEEAKDCATRQYEQIKENNRRELERLDKDRHADFLNMLKGFVNNQVGYSEKIASVWAKAAEDTGGYAKERP